MFKALWAACLVGLLAFAACSSDEQRRQGQQGDAGDDAQGDLSADFGPIGTPQLGTVGLGVAGGETTSAGYRLRFAITAPISTAPATSPNFTTQPGSELRGGGQ